MSSTEVRAAEAIANALLKTTNMANVDVNAEKLYAMGIEHRRLKKNDIAEVYLKALLDQVYTGQAKQKEAIYLLSVDDYRKGLDRENTIKCLAENYRKNNHEPSKIFLDENVPNWRDMVSLRYNTINNERTTNSYIIRAGEKEYCNGFLLKGHIVTVLTIGDEYENVVAKKISSTGSKDIACKKVACKALTENAKGNIARSVLAVFKPSEDLGEGITDYSTRELMPGERLNSSWYFFISGNFTVQNSFMEVSNIGDTIITLNQAVRDGENGSPLYDEDGRLVAVKSDNYMTNVENLGRERVNAEVSASGMGKAVKISEVLKLIENK